MSLGYVDLREPVVASLGGKVETCQPKQAILIFAPPFKMAECHSTLSIPLVVY